MSPEPQQILPKKLIFTLSRCQRIFNPPEMMIWVLMGLSCWVILGFAIIKCWLPPSALFEHLFSIIIVGAIYLFWCIGIGPQVLTFSRLAFGDEYINTVELSPETIRFGINDLELVVQNCGNAVMTSGLFGTYVIRFKFSSVCLVVPKQIIPRHEIETLLGYARKK